MVTIHLAESTMISTPTRCGLLHIPMEQSYSFVIAYFVNNTYYPLGHYTRCPDCLATIDDMEYLNNVEL